MTIQLHLYATSHCHLCEQAEALLLNIATRHDIQWQTVEIAEAPELLALYEIKIPVLKRLDTGNEIFWPFSLSDIDALLGA